MSEMRPQQQLVWYASYGSNMNRDRFMCYIKGGAPPGGVHINRGCSDATDPHGDMPVELPFAPYFAGESQMWTGGCAFIAHASGGQTTKGRAYLITPQQFEEVVAQESFREHAPIDLAKLRAQGRLALGTGSYDMLLHCGEYEGYPIVSFTSPDPELAIAKPVGGYVHMIAQGLVETYAMTDREVAGYLHTIPGMSDWYDLAELLSVVRASPAA